MIVNRPEARLVLVDGSVFEGEAIGAQASDGVTTGELVFNTAMSGYQEILTDPSYAGQIITFTYPHIGNCGVNPVDDESGQAWCNGMVVRDIARRHSNWRAESDLESFLKAQNLAGIAEVDTRRLTRLVRDHGSMAAAFGTATEQQLLDAARGEATTDGRDLVKGVTCREPYVVASTGGERRIVAYDFGIKRALLRQLSNLGEVTVVPAGTPAADVLDRRPDGVFLSNGPGDPAPVTYAVEAIEGLLGNVAVFGVCLGHQLLALALGGDTYKLPFGHHGANQPVRREVDASIEITSQNHNYAIAVDGVAGVTVTHRNLNDGVVEGMRSTEAPAFSVQYHPEAGPGPHDSRYLFDQFDQLISSVTESKGL